MLRTKEMRHQAGVLGNPDAGASITRLEKAAPHGHVLGQSTQQ